jgi:hypothetical protein
MSASRIEYSEKYADDHNEYRYDRASDVGEELRREWFAVLTCNADELWFCSLVT